MVDSTLFKVCISANSGLQLATDKRVEVEIPQTQVARELTGHPQSSVLKCRGGYPQTQATRELTRHPLFSNGITPYVMFSED